VSDVAPHGLHRVTAIASAPQCDVNFYTTALGIRLVKTTVNFDDPAPSTRTTATPGGSRPINNQSVA
jgi:catechol 2,3-dioxygenase-like lactoylglutathione lyase family enzyme